VSRAQVRAGRAVLDCADSDTAVRALLTAYPHTHDIEITSAGLEDAFLALTGDPGEAR
jgi:ABC-2 type transport system ATP-binding protein